MRTRRVRQRCEGLSSRDQRDGVAQVTHDDEEADLPGISTWNFARAMAESTTWMTKALPTRDFKEGVASFVERRPPKFARIKVD